MTIKDDLMGEYTCGRCKSLQTFPVGSPEIACDSCGYLGKDRAYHPAPSEVKLDPSQY